MKNIFNKIHLWWKFEAQYYHKDLIRGIKNLIRWFPTVWKDRDYDHSYIWEILKTKLKHQAKYIGDRDFHVSAKRNAEIMMTCVRLIDKIQNEFYRCEYYDYQHSEFHFTPMKDMEGYSELNIQEIWEKYDDYFAKYPHAYREVTKTGKYIFENKDKHYIAMNMGHYLDSKANRILFKILENNMYKWWD
jgi:hypothetical protein